MGRIIDLSLPDVQLPPFLAVDSNIIIAHLLPSVQRPNFPAASRAAEFFQLLRRYNSTGLVTSTSFNEVFHFAIRATYEAAIANHRADLMARYPLRRRFHWTDLYKIDGRILQGSGPDLERLRQLLTANNLLFIQPQELDPIASGRSLDEEMIHLIGRYGLDTSDTAILLEAKRAGVFSIATLDRDMQRALVDFDVYTWL